MQPVIALQSLFQMRRVVDADCFSQRIMKIERSLSTADLVGGARRRAQSRQHRAQEITAAANRLGQHLQIETASSELRAEIP